jgi:hypothetical protein
VVLEVREVELLLLLLVISPQPQLLISKQRDWPVAVEEAVE